MTRTVALNPTASPPPPEAGGRRLDSLRGATVGFFSNNKPNADVLLERTAAALQERFGITPHFFTKPVPSLEAGGDLLGQCGEACHAVVLAAFDWGSCTSWSVHDQIELARRGCAVVGLVTEEFHDFARELLAQRNAGSLPLAVVQHPIGGIPREQAAARVTDAVVEAVIAALQKERDP